MCSHLLCPAWFWCSGLIGTQSSVGGYHSGHWRTEGGRQKRSESSIYDLKGRQRQRAGNVEEVILFLMNDAEKYSAGFHLFIFGAETFTHLFFLSFPLCSSWWRCMGCGDAERSSGAGCRGLTAAWLMGDRDKGLIRAVLPIWMSCQCSVQHI